MKIAFATTFDAQDVHNWSGTPFYMAKHLNQICSVEYIGNLKRQLPHGFKIKQIFKKWVTGERESPRFNTHVAKNYSKQVQSLLKFSPADMILAPQINPIAFLETQKPIVLWTDAVYASLLGFYPAFNAHSKKTILQGNEMTTEALNRAKLLIFSSHWAARNAIELYGADKQKIAVIPFGANIEHNFMEEEVHAWIKRRSHHKVNLLFIGKRFAQKGGPLVIEIAKKLHAQGIPVELNLVGSQPDDYKNLPSYIHCLGFISKRTSEGLKKMTQLLQNSHFLIVPSQGEAYGIVFCEAAAFGLPSLSTYVGGIPTIIKDHINGKTFSLTAKAAEYCQYIIQLHESRPQYEELCFSAYNEYISRLNWPSAIQSAHQLLQQL